MKKLYEKNELLFALLWVALYCMVLAPIRGELGDDSLWMLLALLAMAVAMTAFILLGGLREHYGLRGWSKHARRCLYFLPMFALATGNLWGGARWNYPGAAQVFAALSMAMVGYVEEVLFRGFLFKALLKQTRAGVAIVISALTFGIGHIINLLTGQASVDTLIQIVFAVSWGFMFTLAYYKGGSLWPCIAVHALIDVCAAFSPEVEAARWVHIGAVIVGAAVYGFYLSRQETAENHVAH